MERGKKARRLVVRPLTPARWADFAALFGPNGACAGCWCLWNRQTSAEFRAGRGAPNKRRMRRLVGAGEVPGLLAYDGRTPVGWVAVGPRAVYKRLETSRVLKPVDDAPVWSAPCFFVAREARGRGVTVALLEAAAAHARRRGARILEGYPVDARGKRTAPAFAWWGLASAFRKAGFREAARRSKSRPIMRRTLSAALLLAALGGAARASAPEPAPDADVEPQVLRSTVSWPEPSWPYYRPDERLAAVEGFVPPGRDAYPRAEGGELLPPKAYGVEERYSKADQERLKKALRAARRYADVNAAVADGYLIEQKYGAGMGIHAHRLDLIFDDGLDPAKPEFLTYALDKAGRWQLLQLGYIRRGLKRPQMFDSPNAKGHFHDENICVAVLGVQLATRFASGKCDGPGERRIGPIWMMHLAVNVFNEKGLFADEFLYADHVSRTGESWSFLGRKPSGEKP